MSSLSGEYVPIDGSSAEEPELRITASSTRRMKLGRLLLSTSIVAVFLVSVLSMPAADCFAAGAQFAPLHEAQAPNDACSEYPFA